MVDTFTARDEEDGTTGITWSLSGADAGDFMISTDSTNGVGTLVFRNEPDFEEPDDAFTSPATGGDNVYDIVVTARDTTSKTRDFAVTVTVTDVNERPDINEDTVPSYVEIEYDADTTVSRRVARPSTPSPPRTTTPGTPLHGPWSARTRPTWKSTARRAS